MARKKQPEEAKGAPAWQSTFSDLMNLLLCFFVLLFSMSSVDAEKYEMVVQSLQQSFSVLPAGGTTVSSQKGKLISSGVSALQQFDAFFNASTGKKGDENNSGSGEDKSDSGQSTQTKNGGSENSQTSGNTDSNTNTASTGDQNTNNSGSSDQKTDSDLEKEYQAQGTEESEQIQEDLEAQSQKYGIQDDVELSFNGQYAEITISGAMLFDSGKYTLKEKAKPVLNNLASMLNSYSNNLIMVEGHTDNVPMHTSKIESNDVLSMYRALTVADYIRSNSSIEPGHIVSSGRGEYDPVADNSTADGRALNRRVTIKIYNGLNSEGISNQ